MPFSVDIATQANQPVPPAQPVPTLASAPRGAAQATSEQGMADAVGSVLTSGTQDGVSVVYDPVARDADFTNTDKGTVAVAAHEALLDPHPQYTTDAEATAIADAAVAAHVALPDPHSQYHTAAEVAADIAAHSAAADPHGDRAYSDAQLAAHGADLDPHGQYVLEADLSELVDDRVAALLVAGTNVTLTYDDVANTLTVDAAGGGGGVTDHGALTGLADNDHPQYVLKAGDTMTGNLKIDAEGSAALVTLYSATDSLTVPPLVYARRSGGTIASPTNVKLNMTIGGFAGQGWDGSVWSNRQASVEFQSKEDWSGSARGTRMLLRTTSAGSVVNTTRAIIDEGGISLDDGANFVNQLASGSYTPTVTGITNVASVGTSDVQYVRVGDVVMFSGVVTCTPTASSAQTIVGISLPIASNFTASTDGFGSGTAAIAGGVRGPASVGSDATTDTVTIGFLSLSTGAHTTRFSGSYLVL